MPTHKESPAVSSRTRGCQQQAASTAPTLDAKLSQVLHKMFNIDSNASPVAYTVTALLRANIFTWFDFVFISDLDVFSNLIIRPTREDLPLPYHNIIQLLHIKTIIDTNIFLDDVDHLGTAFYAPRTPMLLSVFKAKQLSRHNLIHLPLA